MNDDEIPPYNDILDADQQITTEERIAAILFDSPACGLHEMGYSEEECADLGREILKLVLFEFCPQYFEAVDS